MSNVELWTPSEVVPGAALAVRHYPCFRLWPNDRMAVVCHCRQDTALGVQRLGAWTNQQVWDVQRGHEAAYAQRVAWAESQMRAVLEVAREKAARPARSTRARKPARPRKPSRAKKAASGDA